MMFPNNTKILIVDDMMTMRTIVRKTLGGLGFTNVSDADDGETGWAKAQDAVKAGQPFQLIISDWNMPKVKGIDFLRKVRADAVMKSTPFILLTAEAEVGQIADAAAAGVSNYIIKPFSATTLQEKLAAVWAKVNKK